MAGGSSYQNTGDTSKPHGRDDATGGTAPGSESSPRLPDPDTAVAVIGVACRFPGSDSLEEFWELLESGKSMHRDLPKDRFPDSRFSRRGHFKQYRGNLMNSIDSFDHKFFKTSSREASFMDPQQRLALEVAYQALESAGYFTREHSEEEQDIGCYMACCANEYADNIATHPPSAFCCTGTVRPFIAGKVSHYFGFTGPTMMFDAACAASGVAIHQACRAVSTGECAAALAGGTNVFVSPDIFENLGGGHFLSNTGQSKSFDASADGYCRGEGVGIVVLKKLSAALRDGDPIKGVIAATAVNQCSNEVSITIPHGPSQMKLYRKALKMSGFQVQDISYVEAHGTGTPVGDPIEAESIRGVFGDPARPKDETVYMGSLKSNIGHTEASSGVAALIKVLLMMQKQEIAPLALFRNLNPGIAPLEQHGMAIPTKKLPWTTDFKVACVNNYGASGTNSVMIVTQPPHTNPPLNANPSHSTLITSCPISINAFSPSSLSTYCSTLLRYIEASASRGEKLISDLSYHLSIRRNPKLPYSISGTVTSVQGLKDLLRSTASKEPQKRENKQKPVVLFFGGQTGKWTSVPRALYDSLSIFRKHLDECDSNLQELGVSSIYPAIFDPSPVDDLVLSHSILFSEQYASAMAWLDCGLTPARLIGHSFGQYTAMCVSGALSLRDGLRLVVDRARLIQEHWGKDPGSMLAIEADIDWVSDLLAKEAHLRLEIACYNGPQSFVLAGSTASVDALEALLASSSGPSRWKRLKITHAFHTALSEPLLSPLEERISQLELLTPRLGLETCSRGNTWDKVTPALLASHNRDPVYFHQAVERISEQLGSCTWLEAGSGHCAPMLKRALGARASSHTVRSIALESMSSLNHLADLTTELWNSGSGVQFWPFHHSQRHQYGGLNVPPYQFDKARHWLEWKDLGAPAIEAPQPLPEQTSLLQLLQKTKEGAEVKINTKCEEWRALCSAHQILGASVCPTSSLFGLICKAISMTRDSSAQDSSLYDIQDLKIQSPVPAELDGGLNLTITSPDGPQSWRFVLASASGSSHTYALGTIILKGNNNGTGGQFTRLERLVDTTPIRNLKKDVDVDSVKGRAVYQTIATLYQIPKSRQGVKEVAIRGNEAAAHMVMQPSDPFLASDDVLQIPLICLNGLQDKDDDQIYVNTAVGYRESRLGPNLSSNKDSICSVYLRFFGLGSPETTCDIFVFDAQSEQLITIVLDVAFSRVQIGSLRAALKGSAERILPSVSFDSKPPEVPRSVEPFVTPALPPVQAPAPVIEPSPIDRLTTQEPDLPDLTKTLYELLVRVADVEMDALQHDALFAELGVDSLMGMEVAEEINNFFSINIDTQEFAAATDVGTLCRLVADRTTGYCYDSEASHSDTDGAGSGSDPLSSSGSLTDMSTNEQDLKLVSRPLSNFESGKGLLNAALEAFDKIRDEFDVYAKEAGCDKFYSEVYPHQAKLVIAYVAEAFAKLGCDLTSMKAGEKIPNVPHAARYDKLMMQLMRALREDDIITWNGHEWVRTSTPLSSQPSAQERFDQIQIDFPQFASEHVLLDAVGKQLHESLSGDVNPVGLLFGTAAKRKLMADQYLKAPMQCSVSQQLISFVKNCFGSQGSRQVLRVLEIGGGTCGTTLHVVEAFAELAIPVEYTFSDISASFVTGAKAKLAKYDFIKYRTLDITKEPPQDTINQYDMIIATNVIHATPDVSKSAETVRRLLRPDGFITFVEYTESLYWGDIVFGQFEGWWVFNDGREHAIMNEHGWKSTLQRAGFERVEWTRGKCESATIVKIFLAS